MFWTHSKICFHIYLLFVFTRLTHEIPTGCSYSTSDILYTCSARGWSLPLTYTDFNVGQPQRIVLKDMTGNFDSNVFSGFSSINTGAFDSRFTPSLHIICFQNSEILIDSGVFTDLGFIDEFKIVDCDILSLPANVFSGLGDVNLFHIVSGSISNIAADAFTGLNVKKMTQYRNPLGEFGIINAQIVGSSLTTGALFGLVNAEIVRLESAHLLVTYTDMLSRLTNAKKISLNHNAFTKLNEGMFDGLDALEELEIHGISWYCTCGYLWFVDYAKQKNITLVGEYVCTDPADLLNKRLAVYYQETCVEYGICDGQLGVPVGGICLKAIDIVTYGLFVPIAVITGISVVYVIQMYRLRIHKKLAPQAKMAAEKENRFAQLMKKKMEQDDNPAPKKSFTKNWKGAKSKLSLINALQKSGKIQKPQVDVEKQADNVIENTQVDENTQIVDDIDEIDDDFVDLSLQRSERLNRGLDYKLRALENIQSSQGIWVVPPRRRRDGLFF